MPEGNEWRMLPSASIIEQTLKADFGDRECVLSNMKTVLKMNTCAIFGGAEKRQCASKIVSV